MIVKLSYSILTAWEKGRYEDTVGMYLGKEIPATPYMELGKLKHKQWADYTQATGKIHDELGGQDVKNAIIEQKYQKLLPFSKDIQILVRGVIDLEYDDVLVDYKCGRTTPSNYVDGWQLDLYKLLRPQAKTGMYWCFNPYTGNVTKGVKFLNSSNAENALNKIITIGGELIDYLQTNRLLKDFQL